MEIHFALWIKDLKPPESPDSKNFNFAYTYLEKQNEQTKIKQKKTKHLRKLQKNLNSRHIFCWKQKYMGFSFQE